MTLYCCNSGISYFWSINLYLSLVADYDLKPVVVTSLKKYEPKKNVLEMPRQAATLVLCKGFSLFSNFIISAFIFSVNIVVGVNFPVKEKCPSSVHNICSGHLLYSSHLIIETVTMFTCSFFLLDCNMWTDWNR